MKATKGEFKSDPRSLCGSPAGSEAWRAAQNALFGVGCHSLQLDGFRLHLPAPLRERLSSRIANPWLISIGIERHLRVVPKDLWSEYVRRLAHELTQVSSATFLYQLIVQSAVEITIDRANRWSIPVSLANKVDLGGANNRVMILPTDAWIEIWEARHWEHQVKEALRGPTGSVSLLPKPFQTIPNPTEDA